MLNNTNVEKNYIKKILNNIVIQDFFNLNETYLSWNEFLLLIKKADLDTKKYLINLSKKTNWMGSREIINDICNSNSEIVKKLKKDKLFIKKIKKNWKRTIWKKFWYKRI